MIGGGKTPTGCCKALSRSFADESQTVDASPENQQRQPHNLGGVSRLEPCVQLLLKSHVGDACEMTMDVALQARMQHDDAQDDADNRLRLILQRCMYCSKAVVDLSVGP